MTRLKKIVLENYCGYQNFELDLYDGKQVDKWVIFCGPNGIGKSNFIRAAELLTHPNQLNGRGYHVPRILRSVKFNKEYVVQYKHMLKDVTDLKIEGIFLGEDNKEKKIIIEDTYKGILSDNIILETLSQEERNLWEWDKANAISGVTINDMPEISSHSVCVNADKPNNMHVFQLYEELGDAFVDFANAVYGFDCSLPSDSIHRDKGQAYYTDFVLSKPNGTRVHYKSFSDGEKKIATLLSNIFEKAYHGSHSKGNEKILLIDNIEMHIYWKRHMILVEKMEEYFPDHQIICTTHSPIISKEMNPRYIHDIEKYLQNNMEGKI